MKIYNVIEKDENEIFVYSFSSQEKAQEYFNEVKKHLLRMNNCKTDDELKAKYDLGEDSVVIEETVIDLYKLNYELYIEECTLDKWYNFDDMVRTTNKVL